MNLKNVLKTCGLILLQTSWPEAFFGVAAMAVFAIIVIAFFYFQQERK
jgi:hypothetical protein